MIDVVNDIIPSSKSSPKKWKYRECLSETLNMKDIKNKCEFFNQFRNHPTQEESLTLFNIVSSLKHVGFVMKTDARVGKINSKLPTSCDTNSGNYRHQLRTLSKFLRIINIKCRQICQTLQPFWKLHAFLCRSFDTLLTNNR